MYHALDNSIAGNPGDIPGLDGLACRAPIFASAVERLLHGGEDAGPMPRPLGVSPLAAAISPRRQDRKHPVAAGFDPGESIPGPTHNAPGSPLRDGLRDATRGVGFSFSLRSWITHPPRPQAAKYQRHATQQAATAQNAGAVFPYTAGGTNG